MSDFTLVYPFHPYRRLHARSRSIAAIDAIEARFGGHVARVVCNDDLDYSRGVIAHWNDPGDLIICEQDMGPVPEMIEDFLSCVHPACTQPYYLSPASTGFGWPILSVSPNKDGGEPALTPNDHWAGRSAVGLVRLSARVRAGRKMEECFYGNVEHAVNTIIGWRWHVHWPTVPHYHGFKEGDYDRHESYVRKYYRGRGSLDAISDGGSGASPRDPDHAGSIGTDDRATRPAEVTGY